MHLDSFGERLPRQSNDPCPNRRHLGTPDVPWRGNPNLERRLRGQFVEAQRGEQADDASRRLLRDFQKGLVRVCWAMRGRVVGQSGPLSRRGVVVRSWIPKSDSEASLRNIAFSAFLGRGNAKSARRGSARTPHDDQLAARLGVGFLGFFTRPACVAYATAFDRVTERLVGSPSGGFWL